MLARAMFGSPSDTELRTAAGVRRSYLADFLCRASVCALDIGLCASAGAFGSTLLQDNRKETAHPQLVGLEGLVGASVILPPLHALNALRACLLGNGDSCIPSPEDLGRTCNFSFKNVGLMLYGLAAPMLSTYLGNRLLNHDPVQPTNTAVLSALTGAVLQPVIILSGLGVLLAFGGVCLLWRND